MRNLSVIVLLFALVLSPLAGTFEARAQEQVYTDSMDSAETGLLSTDTFDPSISFAYLDGRFVIDVQQPAYQGIITSTLNLPEMANARITVEATIAGDPTEKYVFVGCRHTQAGQGYGFGYWTATGELLIWREDAGQFLALAEIADPTLVVPADTSVQLTIECVGPTISGFVNGKAWLSAQDATIPLGRPTIGTGAAGLQTDGLTALFDNLVVVDNPEPATPTPQATQPPTPLATQLPTQQPAVLPTVQPPAVDAPTAPAPVATTSGQMAPMRDPAVDPAGTLTDAFTVSLNLPPVVADLEIDAAVPLTSLYKQPAGVQLADFYVELYYQTPVLPPDTSYLVGFCFWTDPAGNCYDVYLLDTGAGNATWTYGYDTAGGEYQAYQSGDLPAGTVDPTPGATNFLSLTVYQDVAILSGNTFEAAAVISLQGTALAGDVSAEVGFLDRGSTGVTAPLTILASDFSVWDLSAGMVPVVADASSEQAAVSAPASGPILPPLAGASGLESLYDQTRAAAVLNPPLVAGRAGSFVEENGVYASVGADVSLGDFYTVATFTNPTDGAPFDVGIGFRAATSTESGLRFVIASDGAWYMQLAGQEPYASGPAATFDLSPGASNTIEVLVQGPAATVAINGLLLPQFDLSTFQERGDVYVGAGFYQGDTVTGRVIPYSDWWLFPIDVLDIPSG